MNLLGKNNTNNNSSHDNGGQTLLVGDASTISTTNNESDDDERQRLDDDNRRRWREHENSLETERILHGLKEIKHRLEESNLCALREALRPATTGAGCHHECQGRSGMVHSLHQ